VPGQKRVLVDLGKLKDLHCGLGQVSLQLGLALDGYEDDDLKICFLVPSGWEERFSSPCEVLSEKRRYFPSLCPKYDLWHAIHQDSGYFPANGTPYLLTIHDLNFLGEKTPKKAARRLRKLQAKVDRAAAVTTISKFTCAEVSTQLQFTTTKPVTIYQGVEFAVAEEQKPQGLTDKPFLFSIGAFSAKKNLHTLLPMMRYFPDMKLLLAGKNDTAYGDKIRDDIESLELQDQVVLLGRVTDEERNWLYSHCEAFVFPSLFEGFGMPVLEAYHHGKAVITTKETAIPGFAGQFASYFDGFAPESMANHVRQALADGGQVCGARREYAASFSWESAARSYLALYKQHLFG
jgi:glycosyltransferase involved in cell wall biosynthesis